MTGPGDSSLTAKAIASKSGQRSKSATADNKRSMILFTNKPMLRMGRARGMLWPRLTAVSSRSWRSISGKRESKILARNGGGGKRGFVFFKTEGERGGGGERGGFGGGRGNYKKKKDDQQRTT